MPKLNSRGDVICGVGGIQGSLNGKPYPFMSEGRGCWLDDTTILVSAIARGPGVWRWRPFVDPAGAALERVDPRPYNAIAGGGGRWAACIQGVPSLLFGSLGDIPNGGIPDVALDGTILYPHAYPSDYGLTVVPPRAPGAVPVTIPQGIALYDHALPGGRAIWHGGAYPVERRPRPTLSAVDLQLVEVAGETWLLYWSEGVGIVLQPDGESEGYVIALANGFENHLIARGRHAVAALGLSQGEGPNDYLLLEASRGAARYIGRQGPPIVWQRLSAPVVDPPSPPPPPPPKEPDVSLPDPSAVQAALERERASYPARVTNDQCGAIVNAAARQFLHCGLHRKPAGENSATLPNGVTVNRNVMRYMPPGDTFGWWADVLGAAGAGIATPLAPHWEPSTDDRSSFVEPVGGTVDPPRPPEPPPASTLERRVEILEREVAAQGTTIRSIDEVVDRAHKRIDALEELEAAGVSEDRVRELIREAFEHAVVEGDTASSQSGILRHAHGRGTLKVRVP